jgi:hypothetical protein
MQRRVRAGMIAKLEQRVTEVPKSGMSPKAELAALKRSLNEPVFVARLLRRLLADDPTLQPGGADT